MQNIDTSQLVPGEAQVQVTNTASNLSSNAVTLLVEEGAGAFRIDQFLIDPGFGQTYDPSQVSYPLQRDQTFTLLWQGENLTAAGMDIYVNEVPFVLNGVAQNIDMVTETLDLALNVIDFSISLAVAPNRIPGEGNNVTVQVQKDGEVVSDAQFVIEDPLPPTLYEVTGDWSSHEISLTEFDPNDLLILIYGDNFRGFSTQFVEAEVPSQVLIFPADAAGPTSENVVPLTPLTIFDINILPGFGEADSTWDTIYQPIDQQQLGIDLFQRGIEIPEGGREFRLMVQNPDSGLFSISPIDVTLTITP